MNLEKPFLYFVTPDIQDNLEKWLYLIRQAVLGGAHAIQVRDKTSSYEVILEGVKRIQPFLKENRISLIINDLVNMAREVEADGVHLGLKDLLPLKARKILGPNAIIGFSVEKWSDLRQASEADYLALSPIFPTGSKTGFSTHWGLEGLSAMRHKTPLPLVAIGGIGPHHVPSLLERGATGIAVISAIASHSCPQEAARSFTLQLES